MENRIRRIGLFLEVVDDEGRRHLFQANSRSIEVSDTDCCRDECVIFIGNRRIPVLAPYDAIVEALVEATNPFPGGRQ